MMRVATPADAARLASAAGAFFLDTFGQANSAEDMEAYLTDSLSEEQVSAELSAPDSRVWLAMGAKGEIAGYVHVRQNAPADGALASEGRAVEIARLYADRRCHGQGLGAALMEKGIETALDWHADVLWLGVWERNARAIAFYRKQGFEVVGEQEFMLGTDRQRDLVMARRLTGER
ncbi:MAG TPA: GNAT family N-acetyltransferase [Gemmatimonadaceae bacterium]|jgi:ribosomal protein S18 acetylase RimI-like enzyme